MPDETANRLVGMLCLIPIAALVVLATLLFWATILRTACWMCGVKIPGVFKAMGICLLVAIPQAAAGFGIGLLIRFAGPGTGINDELALDGIAVLVGFPVHLLIAAALYVPLLRTTFGKGILVYLAECLVGLVVGIILAALGTLWVFIFVRLTRQS